MENEKIKILIIEDHVESARLMEVILHRFDANFTVDMTHDPKVGLKQLFRNHYHALVLDYNLPGMNGLQVLDIVRKRNILLIRHL